MSTATALLTALSLFVGYLPGVTQRAPAPTAASTDYELLDRGSYTDEDGREISFAIWRDDGQLQADVSIFDPASGDTLELWLDGETFRFEGVHAGEPFSGAEPASSFDTNPDAPTCAGWVALVCLGAAVILASSSGCVLLDACVPTKPTESPDGGGVPDEDAGEGGGGDGEG